MNIAQHCVIPTLLESTTQEPGIFQVIQGHCTISFETEMNEIEVLRNDRSSWAREVEREGIFDWTKVMQLEDKILGKVGLISPDNPPNAYITQPKLVATRSDKNSTITLMYNENPGTHDALIETTLGSLKSHTSFG
jgi:hypothetical protein